MLDYKYQLDIQHTNNHTTTNVVGQTLLEVSFMKIPNDVSPREAARRLGIRLDAVYALLWAGRLPAQKKDGRWWVDAAAIERRLKAQTERRQTVDSRNAVAK
jgi:hypothetical protein